MTGNQSYSGGKAGGRIRRMLILVMAVAVLLLSGCPNSFLAYQEHNPESRVEIDFFSEGLLRAAFGQSARQADENYALIDRTGGSARIVAFRDLEFNAGKIANSLDGITYLFRQVPADRNFRLSASITVNRFGGEAGGVLSSNGQEGFGIMARDFVPQYPGYSIEDLAAVINDPDPRYTGDEYLISSSIQSGRSNMVFSGAVKRGVRYGYRYGVVGDPEVITDPLLMTDGASSGFVYKPAELDTYVDYPTLQDRPDFPVIGGTYRFTLEKNNSGFFVSMTPPAGSGGGWQDFIWEPDLLTSVDRDYYYVGFFAARSADISIADVSYSESAAALDAPLLEPDPEVIVPELIILSPDSNSHPEGKFYRIIANANVPGHMSVRQNGMTVPGAEWLAADWLDSDPNFQNLTHPAYFDIPVRDLELGENVFQIMFYPDSQYPEEGILIGDTEPIKHTFLVTRKLYLTPSENLYVSPSGRSRNSGTMSSPLDIETAIRFVQPGQTIVMLDGVYELTSFHIPAFNSGRFGAVKRIEAQTRDQVIVDFTKNPYATGAVIEGNYWELSGIHFRNTPNKVKGLDVKGSNNLLEWIKTYNNGDTGFQISGRSTQPRFLWPQNNVVRFSESYNNRDDAEIDADGFGAKLTVGEGNRFEWCLSHNNADDGWDLYSKAETGEIGVVVIENSISYRNGTLMDGRSSAGGKNGYKMGGEGIPIPHQLRNSLAFENGANGVTGNSNPAIILDRVTGFDNGSSSDRNFTIYDAAGESTGLEAQLIGVFSLYSPALAPGRSDDRIDIQVPANGYGWISGASRNANNLTLDSSDVGSIVPPLYSSNDLGSAAVAVASGQQGFIRRAADGSFLLGGFLELIPAVSAGADL